MRHLWRVRIGIDLGGTKIEGIALADGESEIAPAPSDRPSVSARREHRRATTGLMKNCNSTWLDGRALPDDLA